YYSFQSKIYDATRWSFLFGRKSILQQLPFQQNEAFTLLEIGSGTGYNLVNLAKKYPKVNLTGVDVSAKMVAIAAQKLAGQKNVQLINEPYGADTHQLLKHRPKVILFSYALTMMNPQWKDLLLQAKNDLTSIGYIAVVDFHNSPFQWFSNHMLKHHVRMDGHLLPFLQDNFEPLHQSIDRAYGGLWKYFSFVGKLVD
ncbi:MAG: methyltransferase domain-containing protein, partial [Bacteroidota bacterium]